MDSRRISDFTICTADASHHQPRKKLIASAAIVVLGLFAIACDKDKLSTATQPVDEAQVIAHVGQDVITESDLEAELEKLAPQWRGRVKTPGGRKNVIQNIVRRRLILQEAQARGLDKDPGLIIELERLKSARLLNKMLEQDKDLDEALLKQKYEQNKDQFNSKERIHARHILLKIKRDAPKAEEEKVLKRAKKIVARARKGEDFVKLAQSTSEGPTAPNGGDLGTFSRGKMDAAFESAAFDLKVGQISEPVRTSFGFHIIKVEEKLPEQEHSYEEVKKEVAKKYRPQIQRERFEKFLAGLEEKYTVDVKEPPKPAAPAPAKAEPTASQPASAEDPAAAKTADQDSK